ncbi:MAG: flagellar protein FlaG [Pseudomonadales bacterium]
MIIENINYPLLAKDIDQKPVKAVTKTMATGSVPPTTKQVPAEPAQLEAVVSKLNDHSHAIHRTLSFSVEENTKMLVIRVTDTETEELIRQIPNEEALELAATYEEQSSGTFFKAQV